MFLTEVLTSSLEPAFSCVPGLESSYSLGSSINEKGYLCLAVDVMTWTRRVIDIYLQELRVEMSQHQQKVRRRALPDIVRWLLCCLLVMLACNCFVPPTLAFGDSRLVTQEIR